MGAQVSVGDGAAEYSDEEIVLAAVATSDLSPETDEEILLLSPKKIVAPAALTKLEDPQCLNPGIGDVDAAYRTDDKRLTTHGRARSLLAMGDHIGAEIEIRKTLVQAAPGDAGKAARLMAAIHETRGELLLAKGDRGGAKREFSAAVEFLRPLKAVSEDLNFRIGGKCRALRTSPYVKTRSRVIGNPDAGTSFVDYRGERLLTFVSQQIKALNPVEEADLISKMAAKKTFAAMLQTTWSKGDSETINDDGYVVITHLPETNAKISKCGARGPHGVAIVLSPAAVEAWERAGSEVLHFGDSILAVRLNLRSLAGKRLVMFLASAFAPARGRPQDESEQFMHDLHACLAAIRPREIPVVGFSGERHIGRSDGLFGDLVRGTYGLPFHDPKAEELIALLHYFGMRAATTFFRKQHHTTFVHPGRKSEFQFDHIFLSHADLYRARDAGTATWLESVHRAVQLKLGLVRVKEEVDEATLKARAEASQAMRLSKQEAFQAMLDYQTFGK